MAADGPWSGELYHTRPGHGRHGFDDLQSFCEAFLGATGWQIEVSPPSGPDRNSGTDKQAAACQRSFQRTRCSTDIPTRSKFIIAADEQWRGEIYRTRPGLPHLGFESFEQFVLAVVRVSGWQLH
ncbi:hypothetical protein QSJ19_23505 [Gordonia sp. ABSL11-1]|uniref:hypothetical protein n=1 Tax=Gordonia sp. ABSL11-1 TaxID=3053924 RepID=UPI00257421F1|nr:hypothetical protein [Gordonia sp. ABSL11-1]MDL9948495.1 hypothetical protein [Gordonia sp. ABSL11-1]